MRGLKIARKVLLILAVSFVVAGLILYSASEQAEGIKGIADSLLLFTGFGVGLPVTLLIIGTLLLYVNNRIANFVGVGFTAAVYGTVLCGLFMYGGTSSVLGVVGVVLYIVSWVLELAIFYLERAEKDQINPDKDQRILYVSKWKELADKKIITQEEFERKRIQILGLEEDCPNEK